ncbi:MAG: efflux RND transporter periplasmic adaptor subunit [Muribaculaceae bacterium]|nr:efflux RND transporter periplasmic adaptor subunit [Muribaculaceae bacterium]MBQ4007606.1 efflux RND transporter periplasmic adaptor subunit [Muribaculaceae bacterium]
MATENNNEQFSKEFEEVKQLDQKTTVKKKDRAMLAALAVFVLAIAGVAVAGILALSPDDDTIQGQADCETTRVSGKLPGRIVKFYVKEGDYVHKGDKLVSIYSSTVDAKLSQARSMQGVAASQSQKVDRGTRDELKNSAYNVWQQAKAAEEIAQKTYQRMQSLYAQGVVTEQKRDEAKAAYDAAVAQVQAAKSQYDLAVNGAQREDKSAANSMEAAARAQVREVESLLEDQVLVAPCDGEVSEIYPHEGELVAMGTPIMTISKLYDMWVSFSVREEKLKDMPMNKEISVTIPALGNKQTKLQVFYIHDMGSYAVWQATKATGEYDSKTFEVKARPVELIEDFRPGMSVLLNKTKAKADKKK